MPDDFATLVKKLANPATPYGALSYGLIILLLAWLSGRLLKFAVERALRPKHLHADPTAIRFLGQLARVAVYVFAFVSYAHLIPALRSLGTAWLASVGVVSVVFGLAAQNTLGNLIAGISLLLYRPFNMGDTMQISAPTGLETGVVESLNLGYTVLRTLDNRRIVIPNSAMASQASVNLSLRDERILCVLPISISQSADLDKARAHLLELARKLSGTAAEATCPVTAIGNGITTLSLKIWCADYQTATQLKYDLFESIRKRFQAEGIDLK